MSRLDLKVTFRKGNYLPGSYDVVRLQDENLRENVHGPLNTKMESLKFDNVDGWNDFSKIVF